MIEQWRPVPGYEGRYDASDQGRIKSIERKCQTGRQRERTVPERILTTEINVRDGHHRVRLFSGGGIASSKRYLLHRLVLEAFTGPPSVETPIGRHLNGNPDDNRLVNLEWSTHSRNALDKVTHGTSPQRNRTHCPQQHPYDGANLAWERRSNGRRNRTCRECKRARNHQQYLARLRAAQP